jgi:predicted nucleic acid-binding protein
VNAIVVDCSVTMAWCFEDECDALADAVLGRIGEVEVWVPSIWPLEVANVLLVAERRGRLDPSDSTRFLELLGDLPILVDGSTHERAFGAVVTRGRALGLSSNDAAYVDLAERRGALLATRDSRMAAAGAQTGIQLFEPQS